MTFVKNVATLSEKDAALLGFLYFYVDTYVHIDVATTFSNNVWTVFLILLFAGKVDGEINL